jgi:hypothetical protein
MSKPYAEPPKYIELFATCKDASNPPKDVQDWVEENKMYRVLGFRQALNTDEISVILADKDRVEMQPSYSMGGYKGSRFELIQIILN